MGSITQKINDLYYPGGSGDRVGGASAQPLNLDTPPVNKLQQQYHKIVNKYIRKFEKKQGMYFEYWVADRKGEVACFGDFFFEFSELRFDIDNNITVGKIIDWHNYIGSFEGTINFENWLKLEPADSLTSKV